MLSEMTPAEMDGWIAYEQLEPFGTKQMVHMLGQLLRSQLTGDVDDVDDEDLANIMGYTEPRTPIGDTSKAITAGFGAR